MRYFRILSLPHIKFAHDYEATDYDVCLHKVNQSIEITCLTAGSLTVTDDDQSHCARAGDIICNLYQSDLQVQSRGFHSHRTVCFSVAFAASAQEDAHSLMLPVVTPACERSGECLRLIREIIRISTLYPEDTLRCSGLFLQLLNELSNINRRAAESAGELRYVRGAKKYVYEHIREPIRQRDIAASLGITPEYLCAVFKKSEGCPIMRFINTAKLNGIRSLMEKEGLTLSQAALLYGYTDPNYVSRLYKQYFHINITAAVPGYPCAPLEK